MDNGNYVIITDDGYVLEHSPEYDEDMTALTSERRESYTWYEPVQVGDNNRNGFIMISQQDGAYTVRLFEDDSIISDVPIEDLRPLTAYVNSSFVDIEMCDWTTTTITSVDQSGVYRTDLGDITFTVDELRATEERFSILDSVSVQNADTGDLRDATIIKVDEERNSYTVVYVDGSMESDISGSQIYTARRRRKLQNEAEEINSEHKVGCIEPLGLVKDALQQCENVLKIYGCDDDLSELHPSVEKGSFLRDMCPCSCANERRRRRLQNSDQALYLGDHVLLDGVDTAIIRIAQGGNRFTIELQESGAVLTGVEGTRLSYVDAFTPGIEVEAKQCSTFHGKVLSILPDGRYRVEFLTGLQQNVAYSSLSSSAGYLRLYDEVSVKIDNNWESNYEIILVSQDQTYSIRHKLSSEVLDGINKSSLRLDRKFQL